MDNLPRRCFTRDSRCLLTWLCWEREVGIPVHHGNKRKMESPLPLMVKSQCRQSGLNSCKGHYSCWPQAFAVYFFVSTRWKEKRTVVIGMGESALQKPAMTLQGDPDMVSGCLLCVCWHPASLDSEAGEGTCPQLFHVWHPHYIV